MHYCAKGRRVEQTKYDVQQDFEPRAQVCIRSSLLDPGGIESSDLPSLDFDFGTMGMPMDYAIIVRNRNRRILISCYLVLQRRKSPRDYSIEPGNRRSSLPIDPKRHGWATRIDRCR